MSEKPTPGPYRIETHLPDRIRLIGGNGACIAVFRELSYDGGRVEAEANARAFVDGMAAREELDRIHAVVREWGESRRSSGACMVDIAKILDEAKP